jgi:xylulokinase
MGSGTVCANDLMMYLGTAATLIGTTSNLEKIVAGPAFNSGYIYFIGNVLSCCKYLNWFKEKMQLDGDNYTFDQLEEMASKINVGSDGLISLPHLEGERTPIYNPIASGSILGINSKHTAAHIYRAILESISYAMLDGALEKRHMFKRFVVSGGAAKSKLFRQILADVFNSNIEYNPKSEASLGAAYFAGYSLGLFKDFNTLRYVWLNEMEITEPNAEHVKKYESFFTVYKRINETLVSIYPLLDDLKRGEKE